MKPNILTVGQYARNLTTNQTCEVLAIDDNTEIRGKRAVKIREVEIDNTGGFTVINGMVKMYERWIFEDLLKPINKLT